MNSTKSIIACYLERIPFQVKGGNQLNFKNGIKKPGLSERIYFDVVYIDKSGQSRHVVVKNYFERIADFQRAKDVLTRAGNHPNLVTLVDSGEDYYGARYHVYEQEETDLFGLQSFGEKLSDLEIIVYLLDILGGLDAIHTAGFVCPDLKSENIFVTGFRAKIGDLDKAEVETDFKRQAGQISEEFLPPEYLFSGNYTKRSDIFAAGLILYRLVTRHNPRLNQPGRYCSIPTNLNDSPFYSIIFKATEGDPEKRYQTVTEMRDDLIGLLSQGLPFKEQEFAGFGRAEDDFDQQITPPDVQPKQSGFREKLMNLFRRF